MRKNTGQIRSLIFIVAVLVIIAFMAVIALMITGQDTTSTISKQNNISAKKDSKSNIASAIDLHQVKIEPVNSKSINQIKKSIATKIYEFKSKENIDNKIRQLMNQQISKNPEQYIKFYNSDNLYKHYFNKNSSDNVLGDSIIIAVSKLGLYSGDEKYIFVNTNGYYEIVKKFDIDGNTDKIEIADDHIIINTYNYTNELSEGKSSVIMSIDDDYKVVWSGITYSHKLKQNGTSRQLNENYLYGSLKIYSQFDSKTQKDQIFLNYSTFKNTNKKVETKLYIMDKLKYSFIKQ